MGKEVVEQMISQLEDMLKLTADPARSLFSADELQNELLDLHSLASQLQD
jgi:hypothetical protein